MAEKGIDKLTTHDVIQLAAALLASKEVAAAAARATAAEALLAEALDHLAAFAVLGEPTSPIRRFLARADVRQHILARGSGVEAGE